MIHSGLEWTMTFTNKGIKSSDVKHGTSENIIIHTTFIKKI